MMVKSSYIVVFITCAGSEESHRIAAVLIERKKAACVNIISGVSSIFWWQGRVDTAEEYMLIVKSEEKNLDEIIETVKSLHSYSVPEIIALPIIGGNNDYLNWVKKSVNGKSN